MPLNNVSQPQKVKITKDGMYKYYSNLLGRYDDFLSVYKHHHKGVCNYKTPQEWYEHVLKRQEEQEEVIATLQRIYYYLIGKKSVSTFGAYLVENKIYTHKNCFASLIQSTFELKENFFIQLTAIRKYKLIATIFKEKYGDLDTLEEAS